LARRRFGDDIMRNLISFAAIVFVAVTSPAFAADKAAPAPKTEVPQEFELPEITITLPAAKFEHAIVRDNEVPVVLLLV
jgi:hypothetical protein